MCLIKDGYNFSQIYGMLSPGQVYDESEQTTNSEEGFSAYEYLLKEVEGLKDKYEAIAKE